MSSNEDESNYSQVINTTIEEIIAFNPTPAKYRRYFTGWRFGVISCLTSVAVVFIINVVIAMVIALRTGFGNFGLGVLYEGSCSQAQKMDLVSHILINALSTILLSSSNYCMQCLSAPTRKEIDTAHARGEWLEIGVPSLKNLRRIDRKRAFLWLLIGLSSIPLHLFYNSTIVTTVPSNSYNVLAVNKAFTQAQTLNITQMNIMKDIDHQVVSDLHSAVTQNKLQKLDSQTCMSEYGQEYLTSRSDLVLLLGDDNSTDVPECFGQVSVSGTKFAEQDPFSSICDGIADDCAFWIQIHHTKDDDFDKLDPLSSYNQTSWTPRTVAIARTLEYCLSRQTPEHCKLQFNLFLMLIVIIFNIFKLASMSFLAFGMKETPLMTIGDSIASFLTCEESLTNYRSLLSRRDFERAGRDWPQTAKRWSSEKIHWGHAASIRRWTWFFILCITVICAGIPLLQKALNSSQVQWLGIGDIGGQMTLGLDISSSGAEKLIMYVLVANIAQPILSLIYFNYNGIFTSMLAGREWSQFAKRRKGLRVSDVPAGSQRSTYFLQLPYRYAVPIMILSGVIHWLVSQSFVLVAIEPYDFDGSPMPVWPLDAKSYSGPYLALSYSSLAIFLVFMMIVILMASTVLLAAGPSFLPGLPLAGNCSAVVAAACHVDREKERDDVAQKALKWGVVSSYEGVYHCAFSSKEVERPNKHDFYA